jgi:hypothetical protein
MAEQSYGGQSPPPSVLEAKYRMRNWIESRNSKGVVVVVLVALATDLT